jgi:ABC-type sugar transport system permease subunit
MISTQRSERWWGPLYALPGIMLIAAFIGYPLISIVYHAFTKWDGFGTPTWNGLRNFELLASDSQFWASLANNVFFALSIPVLLIVPLVLAYYIHSRIRGWRLFRWTYFLPAVFATVVVGIIARFTFALDGPINEALTSVGLGGLALNWLADSSTALPAILIVLVWAQFGYNVVLYLAGISGIDPSLPEAARIDGASDRQIMRHVYVPGLRRVMEIVLVTNTITVLAFMFPYVYTITNGGPGFKTYVAEFYIYNSAFTFHRMGYASAMGMLLTVIIAVIGFIQIRVLTRGSDTKS